ncbi:hypothetical protein ACFVS2_26855 [Brevibacillus sp. NPDC058079]|uniref:hypothetical protein n=1 Tax=Brevibacillus sp. NPDC058079 TaxID=3346330 RepID=UPI0036E33893
MSYSFLGVCDRFRKTETGERLWQEMMQTKKAICESEFLQVCNVQRVLDDGEQWEEYKDNARLQNDEIRFYKSKIGLYFFQTAGFEFIWGDPSQLRIEELEMKQVGRVA